MACSVSGCAQSLEQEVNMDKLSSTVYVLIVALCAFPHFGTVFHAHALRRGGISTVKPGLCPHRLPAALGPCVESCSTDSDCHDSEKCCSNGCGHECMVPDIVKPGVCPLGHPPTFGPCVESCSKDSDCTDKKKCCSNGCGHECMAPYIGEK
uniref:WAP domain-containing protein n=1 Tax=Astatotilapia calliptera TaxID=8154 RepID=A0A3P8R4V2_ASTCA